MTNNVSIQIKRLPHGADLPLPAYESAAAAGMDLRVAIEETMILEPGTRALVPTGISIGLLTGYEAQVRPRSGLALKSGITFLPPATVWHLPKSGLALKSGITFLSTRFYRLSDQSGLALKSGITFLPFQLDNDTKKSGLALKSGITFLNTPGTIDADYRGEVGVILINHGTEPFQINRGDRIGQLVIAPVTQGIWVEVDELDSTERGAGGFGSSGTK